MDLRAIIKAEAERQRPRLTPYMLAKRAGVHESVVYRYLSGERDINAESAARLLDALGLVVRPRARANKGKPQQ